MIKELNDRGCYVICRKNIGQDFGAWKDCFALINYYKLITILIGCYFATTAIFVWEGKIQKYLLANLKII